MKLAILRLKGDDMPIVFKSPDFKTGDIELIFEENEICIYATDTGMKKLISFCEMLLKKPERGHIHIEDYEVLTTNSLKGSIAIFKQTKP